MPARIPEVFVEIVNDIYALKSGICKRFAYMHEIIGKPVSGFAMQSISVVEETFYFIAVDRPYGNLKRLWLP